MQRDNWVKIGKYTEIKNPKKDPETGELLIEAMRVRDERGQVRMIGGKRRYGQRESEMQG